MVFVIGMSRRTARSGRRGVAWAAIAAGIVRPAATSIRLASDERRRASMVDPNEMSRAEDGPQAPLSMAAHFCRCRWLPTQGRSLPAGLLAQRARNAVSSPSVTQPQHEHPAPGPDAADGVGFRL